MITSITNTICCALSAVICFTSSLTGLWADQLQSIQTIQKVCDGFYTMDYTYDYDIDEMFENGISNHVELILNGITNTIFTAHGRGCTTFNAINNKGEKLFARNFDYTESPFMLLWTHPKDGYKSISTVTLEFLGYTTKSLPQDEFTSVMTLLAPYACMDGMNEKGLSIAILELETSPTFQISKKPNLTTSAMVRAVLDKAATVDEAIEIFRTHDMRDFIFAGCTYHYQIADAKGNTAVIEYVNHKMRILYPEKSRSNYVNFMASTNFYLSKDAKDPKGLGHERYDIAYNSLKKCGGRMSESTAMKTLQSVSVCNEDMNGYICSTLWSEVYNLQKRTVDICPNLNYKKTYHFSLNKPQKLI